MVDQRIRILYLLWSGSLGGAERHVFDLVTALPRDRFEPMVCFLSNALVSGDLLEKADVKFVEMRLSSGFDIRGIMRFFWWLRRERFDLIHEHGSTPWSIPVAKTAWSATRAVRTEHAREYSATARWVGRISTRCVDQHIAVSCATQNALEKDVGIPRERVAVIPNFVDVSRFKMLSENEICGLRNSMGVPPSGQVLISVGRLIASKNFDRLISFLRPLFRKYPQLYLLIVGDGILRESLVAQIEQAQLRDRIKLLGNRLDVPDLLAISDVFVFLSRIETFGIAVIEAMVASKPVVALRIPGLDEVIVAGETGIMVDEANLENDFIRALDNLLQDPVKRARMGESGRERVLAKYEKSRVVEKIISLYE